ncbi:MAG: thymidylate synthase [Magnetospirillum gryphiswaldense]|nr:thymidylate synthase [Magnetospirillum gryphiswaldense]
MKGMLAQFQGDTADEIWRQAAAALTGEVGYLRQDSRLGATRELLHSTFHLHNPRQRWVLSRRPVLNPAFAIAEVVWILQGRNDAAFLNFWNPLLPKFAGEGTVYDGAYGHRLRVNLGLDQIERAYKVLVANPSSRQTVLQIWDGRTDMPNEDGSARSADIPCNVVAMPKVREGRLEWLQVMRSNDLYLGTPHNFIQFTTLQEVMAGWLGLEVGSYVQLSDSLHLYEHDMAKVEIAHEPPAVRNHDRLDLPKPEFDRVLSAIGSAMDRLRAPELRPHHFRGIYEKGLPDGWQNMLRIAAADAARRRGWSNESQAAGDACGNEVLWTMWASWAERKRKA